MKITNVILSVFTLFYISMSSFSQSGYDMKEGETIYLDNEGNIIGTNMPEGITSKYRTDIPAAHSSKKNSSYNEDGTLKIPGYTPSGNKEADEQNYKKAKYLLYQNNYEEYQKIFDNVSSSQPVQIITPEEFNNLPENKQQQILTQPEKYKIEKND
ncbi:MAG: hypothetical protein HY738_10095 [Bacteroidia bacterium]|nr:hypothetical protein [Bacteroidia bacterium]